jgi:hypothetical protein
MNNLQLRNYILCHSDGEQKIKTLSETTKQHQSEGNNNLQTSKILSVSESSNTVSSDIGSNSTAEPQRCSGKNCKNYGTNLLEIRFIVKTGYFCDVCTKDLLNERLATAVGEIV